nr:MAG TPA: hypothetical protein [Bacteriophage sp.]
MTDDPERCDTNLESPLFLHTVLLAWSRIS